MKLQFRFHLLTEPDQPFALDRQCRHQLIDSLFSPAHQLAYKRLDFALTTGGEATFPGGWSRQFALQGAEPGKINIGIAYRLKRPPQPFSFFCPTP